MTRKKKPDTIESYAQWGADEVFTFSQGGVVVDGVVVIVSGRQAGETFLVCKSIGNDHANEKAIELVADGGMDEPEPVQPAGDDDEG